MHRRTLTCVSQATPTRHILQRTYQHAASGGRADDAPYRATDPSTSKQASRHAADAPARGKNRMVQSYTEKIIAAHARGAAKPPPTKRALERTADTGVPSVSKLQFMSGDDAVDVADVAVADPDSFGRSSVSHGSFIELRRNQTSMYGVTILNAIEGQVMTTYTLASTGEIWKHRPTDVMFAIPKFVDLPTVERCGHEDGALTAHQLAARVKILRQIRQIEKSVEANYHDVALRTSRVLDGIAALNTDEWGQITTKELATLVGGKKTVTKLCVHKYLMQNYVRFVAQPGDFLTTQLFWVRPKSHVEEIEKVTRMLAADDPAVDAFIEKARNIILELRQRPSSSSGAPSIDPEPLHTFNTDEQLILRFLEHFDRAVRKTQRDPYLVPVCTIVKKLGLYSDAYIQASTVHTFLTELGIIPPWDDPVLKDRELRLATPKEVQQKQASALPTQGYPAEDEFYPEDFVSHIRHDFGDLPAFVIDDAGAQELDDAISVERIPHEPGNYWIHVHIADPTLKLHPNHNLVKTARERSTTQYDVQQTIPMIPSSIMFSGLSLGSARGAGQSSVDHTLTFSCKVDETGDILDYVVRAGILRNVQILTYNDVNHMLGFPSSGVFRPFGPDMTLPPTKQLDDSLVANLRILDHLTQKMVERRLAQGVFWWGNPKSHLSARDQKIPSVPLDFTRNYRFTGFPTLLYEVETQELQESGARRLVAECMKAACRVASRFCRDRGLPAIRRAAEPMRTARPEDLDTLLAKRNALGAISLADAFTVPLVALSSEYTLLPKGHWQLGVADGEGYTRVTSPLRRFSDMVMHWQIKHALADPCARPCFSADWLRAYMAELSYKEIGMGVIDRRHQMFWAIKYIERWQQDPENYRERPNPLDDLEVLVTKEPLVDLVSGRHTNQVLVPQLGLVAKLDPGDTLPQVGEVHRARFSGTKLGPAPELRLTKI